MPITIENKDNSLDLSDIDKWDEVIMSISDKFSEVSIFINHEDATKIINHLKQQFLL